MAFILKSVTNWPADSAHSQLGYRIFVQIDTQAGLLRYFKISVLGADCLLGKNVSQVRALLRHEFDDERIRDRVQPVQRCRHVDVSRKPVVRDGTMGVSRK